MVIPANIQHGLRAPSRAIRYVSGAVEPEDPAPLPPGPAIVFQQTDTIADHQDNVACSGLIAGANTRNMQLEIGGTPGSGSWGFTVPTEATRAHVFMESAVGEPNQALWDAGTWTVQLRILGHQPNVKIKSCHICRVDSHGVNKGRVAGDDFDITTLISVHELTLAGIESQGLTTDRVQIIVGMAWQGAGGTLVRIRPNQTVTTPILTRAA